MLHYFSVQMGTGVSNMVKPKLPLLLIQQLINQVLNEMSYPSSLSNAILTKRTLFDVNPVSDGLLINC